MKKTNTRSRFIHLKKGRYTMKKMMHRTSIVVSMLFFSLLFTSGAQAATNDAINEGTGTTPLSNSTTSVTVTSTQLGLVKVVYDTSGNCLASSDSDGTCNGGATTVSVPTGTELVFAIYVANTTAISATDIRFQDNIDDVATDYFEFQPNAFAAATGIAWATRAATGATKVNIWTALATPANLTNAFDGSTGSNEYCGIDTTASPDQLICGGDAVSPDNDQVDVTADTLFAIKFHVIKRD